MNSGADSQFGLTKLASKYYKMIKDGRVLSNRHSIEIIRDRVVTLMERLDENDAPDRLKVIEGLWEKYKQERDHHQETDAVITRSQIDAAFEAARTDFAVWNQMIQLLDLDRKMVESEVKIVKDIKAIMTAEEGVQLVAKLMAAVFAAVNGSEIENRHKGNLLKRIQFEFTRIIGDNIGEDYTEGIDAGLGEIIDA